MVVKGKILRIACFVVSGKSHYIFTENLIRLSLESSKFKSLLHMSSLYFSMFLLLKSRAVLLNALQFILRLVLRVLSERILCRVEKQLS